MRRLLLLGMAAACARPAPQASLPAVPARPAAQAPAGQTPATMPPQRLRIIGTNDFHGALEPRPDETTALRGGAANLAAAIRRAQRECQPPECVTLLVDGGDMFQGTPASNFVFGRPVVEIYNYLGYSAAALGNHEFDWGQDTLRALMRAARYPILGANVRYKADGRDVPWIPNDTIVQRGPLRIGIIGLATVETPSTTLAEHVADLSFVDAVPIIDSIAPRLRDRGADFVVVIGHIAARCSTAGCSGEAIDIANRLTTKVDVIISGHSHTRADTEVRGIPVVQARSRGQAIDVVDVYTSGAPSTHEVREIYADSVVADPNVAEIVAAANRFLDRIAPQINRPVARIATTMRSGPQHPLGNLIADAMRVTAGGDLAVMNSGGVRQALVAGVATYGSLFEVQPFGNKLVRVRVRGSDLRAYFARALERGAPNFHLSGARIVYHAGTTPGLDSLTIQGRPVLDQAIYTVVLNDFSANGGDRLGFGAAAISTQPANLVDLDALIAYLSSLPQPVTPPADARVIRRP